MFPLKGFDNDYFFRVKTTEENYPNYLCFTGEQDDCRIFLKKYGSPDPISVEVSYDRKNWINLPVGNTYVPLNSGEKVYFRGNNETFSKSSENYYYFQMSGKVSCSGNIMSLLDKTCLADSLNDYAFYRAFRECTSLISAPELPATNLGKSCYSTMFSKCTSLISAPELPATTLKRNCYGSMFFGCTSLISAPELPALIVEENSYSAMFSECTSLISAPELPATTAGKNGYERMFKYCTNLKSVQTELPATTIGESCYSSMFYGCENLEVAPKLPATTLAKSCYDRLFYRCLKLRFSQTQDSEYTIPYRIPTSGTGTTASGAFSYMFGYTGGTFTGNPTINKTYYLAGV